MVSVKVAVEDAHPPLLAVMVSVTVTAVAEVLSAVLKV
jgi:hypothetical protein